MRNTDHSRGTNVTTSRCYVSAVTWRSPPTSSPFACRRARHSTASSTSRAGAKRRPVQLRTSNWNWRYPWRIRTSAIGPMPTSEFSSATDSSARVARKARTRAGVTRVVPSWPSRGSPMVPASGPSWALYPLDHRPVACKAGLAYTRKWQTSFLGFLANWDHKRRRHLRRKSFLNHCHSNCYEKCGVKIYYMN